MSRLLPYLLRVPPFLFSVRFHLCTYLFVCTSVCSLACLFFVLHMSVLCLYVAHVARCLFVLPVDGQWNVFLCRLVIDLLGHSQNECNFEERISKKDRRL